MGDQVLVWLNQTSDVVKGHFAKKKDISMEMGDSVKPGSILPKKTKASDN